MAEREGVVKYRAEHREVGLAGAPEEGLVPVAAALAAWRHPLRGLGWIGQDPERYGGYGFGNLSARVAEGFLVTGSQTGGVHRLDLDGFALVERWDLAANRLWSRGRVPASSESLTHAALYQASAAAASPVGAVFHVHAPELWREREGLGLPVTDPAVPYGTPEMAAEVVRAWRRLEEAERSTSGLLAMGGHEDGLLAWGPAPERAGQALLDALLRLG